MNGRDVDVLCADWEWPDARQDEIAVQGTSVSSTTCVGMFGFEAA
jgi:hypothetical protein